MLRKWEELPEFMRIAQVRTYWETLHKKRGQLALKRAFDLVLAWVLLLLLAVPMAGIAVLIKVDSPGPAFYRQKRVTAYGRCFYIHKFRTMVVGADRIGTSVTVGNDSRITRVGAKLRKWRLDELPQILDVISGTMSFVGTRPEAIKYVRRYKPEYYATFLMPAGITSEASIRYKDEGGMLDASEDVDDVYVNRVLQAKMEWNLESIKRFCFLRDILTMVRTVFIVFGKNYNKGNEMAQEIASMKKTGCQKKRRQ